MSVLTASLVVKKFKRFRIHQTGLILGVHYRGPVHYYAVSCAIDTNILIMNMIGILSTCESFFTYQALLIPQIRAHFHSRS